MKKNWISILIIIECLTTILMYSAERVTVVKEIDDEHIIISRKNGERLLLEKWSLRFSPLLFEGKILSADISPLWVTIYFEGRDPIKWTIKENLGGATSASSKKRLLSSTPAISREIALLAQAALSLLGYDDNSFNGVIEERMISAISEFQKSEKLPQDENIGQATLRALSTQLYRKYPNNQRVLTIAATLLSAAFVESKIEDASSEDPDIIESCIKGNFEGWDGETIFLLDNGQIWQQVSFAYTYHYAFRPKVTIFMVNGLYKMMVERVNTSIFVKRIK